MPFKGGGAVAKQLAGKHCNSTVNNPSEQLGFYEAGTTKAIAAFTPERLPLFPDAPTFRELGQDYVYFMQRSVVGAPGMSAERRRITEMCLPRSMPLMSGRLICRKRAYVAGF